ncbi:MFS transporter [Halorarius litoreus]|uniref:MFS transporter n=1 Tax=Halorarius litoreus TaxID=2962676 RepID=UPI0020CE8C84|nr:MFS transporter [Halorarius litoreus]
MARTPSVVARYYLYMATSTLGFLIPVWVVLLDETRGFTYTQITTLDVVFFATILLAELPTGYVGDRLGRRNALVLSSLAVGLSAAVFGLVEAYSSFLVVYIAWGIAQTFRSGNDSAWLYDTLQETGAADAFARVRGRGLAVLLGTNALTAAVGGHLFRLDPSYPFIATGLVNGLSALVLLTLPETDGGGEQFTLAKARKAVSRLTTPRLRSFVLYIVLFYGIGWSADLFVQPIARAAGLSFVELGYLFAGLIGVSAVASNYAGAIEARLGTARVVHLSPLLLGGLFVVLGLFPILAVPVFLVHRSLLNATTPIAEGYFNDLTPSLGRATALSAISMAMSAASIPVKLVSGPLADATSLFTTVAILGGGLLVFSVAVLVWERPVQPSLRAAANGD